MRRASVAWIVALSLVLAAIASAVLAAPAAAISAADLAAFRSEVLQEVNKARAIAGSPPIVADAALTTAAQAHAEYLLQNAALWGSGLSAHDEQGDLPGFTGRTSSDRVIVAGFPHPKVIEEVFRGHSSSAVSSSPWSPEELVAAWVDAPLHRRGILDLSVLQMGFGYATDGYDHAYVFEAAQDHLALTYPSAVQPYPADGQTGVPVDWDGVENPPPFEGLTYPCGYPITVFPIHGGSTFVASALELVRKADGLPVGVVQSTVRNIAFAPIAPLEPGTTYRAKLTYTMRNEYTAATTSGVRTWDFTTAGTATPTTTTTGVPVTTTTTTLGSPTTTLPVTTSTTTPTTSTTVPHPSVFSDVPATHPYQEAVEQMAAAGVVEGYRAADGARTFKPDNPVARQQFAKMIARALALPVSEADVCPFTDVASSGPDGLYPDNYVAAVASRGITRGTSSSPPLFSPWKPISRAQVITMVVRAAQAQLPGRLEPAPSSYVGLLPSGDPIHGQNLRLAEANGLLEGVALAEWDVWAPCSRAEVAQILWNLVE